jgi:acetolactate synthase-1/2/3 large subunit
MRTGGEILADSLIAQGCDRVTMVPGESFLPFIDAAWHRRDQLRLLTCRHEGGAAYMAEALGKLTGKPGVCFVTRGPGATHAAVGIHTAFQDSTPMVLLVGQVDKPNLGREAFQEVDLAAMFTPLAKKVEQIDDAGRIPEAVARAFAAAQGGRPGPVVLVFPEDVLSQTADIADCPPVPHPLPHPGPCQMARFTELLSQAKRPLMIVGGGGWNQSASVLLKEFAEKWSIPVAAAFRRQDLMDHDSDCYVGELGFSVSPSLQQRVQAADLILAIGTRLGEIDTSGYTLLKAPVPSQTLIHVFPAAEELGRVYVPSLGIPAAPPAFLKAALQETAPGHPPAWEPWTKEGRSQYLANLEPSACPGNLDLGQIMKYLDGALPDDAILCTGAGNYTGWVQRFRRFRQYGTQLAPANGSMGYGLPAALAAKAVFPDRTVLAFAGDGCFLMTAQELATAKLHGLSPIVLVIDNGMYGTIRMHQEANHPGHALATDLANPDFAALAASYGAWTATVTHTQDFAAAYDQARLASESGRLSLLHLLLNPEAITTRTTLSAIRDKAARSST